MTFSFLTYGDRIDGKQQIDINAQIVHWLASLVKQGEVCQPEQNGVLSDAGTPVWVVTEHMLDPWWWVNVYGMVVREADDVPHE